MDTSLKGTGAVIIHLLSFHYTSCQRMPKTVRKSSTGAYRSGVSARTELGHQQGFQLGPINVPIMYNLLSRHDAETLAAASDLGLDEVCGRNSFGNCGKAHLNA